MNIETYMLLYHSGMLATIRTLLADLIFGYGIQINPNIRAPSPWRELGNSRMTRRTSIANSGDLCNSDAC